MLCKKSKNMVNFLSNISGMSYSLNDEPKIWKEIVKKEFDLKYTSQFADHVCINGVNDIAFLEDQLNDKQEEKLDNCVKEIIMNPTSFGNVAYTALHAPEPYNERAHKLYDKMITKVTE